MTPALSAGRTRQPRLRDRNKLTLDNRGEHTNRHNAGITVGGMESLSTAAHAFACACFRGVVKLAATAVTLARLFAVEPSGLLAVAMLVINFGSRLSEFGTAQALIQRATITVTHVRAAFSLAMLFGSLVSAVIWLGAPLAASAFRADAVASLLRAIGLMFVLGSFGTKRKRSCSGACNTGVCDGQLVSYGFGYAAVAVCLAVMGFWDVVAGMGDVDAVVHPISRAHIDVTTPDAAVRVAPRNGPASQLRDRPDIGKTGKFCGAECRLLCRGPLARDGRTRAVLTSVPVDVSADLSVLRNIEPRSVPGVLEHSDGLGAAAPRVSWLHLLVSDGGVSIAHDDSHCCS
jgi:PST family polysaccharide transporter